METEANVPKLRFPEFTGEWGNKRLIEVAEFYSGGTPLTSRKEYFGGDIPFIRSGEINQNKTEQFITDEGLKNSSAKMVSEGDILYALYGATSGEVGISKINGAINQAILCIKSSQNHYFIYSVLKFMKDTITKTFLQGGQGNLSAEIVKNISFGFPSIQEQTKIASFLTAVDHKLQALKKKKELLEQYKKGMMQQLFSQEIRFKKDDGTNYPEWEEKKLGEVATFRRGSFPQPYGLAKWYDDENGMPFVQVFDVDDNMLLKSKTKNKISKLGSEQSVFVKKGTLVITIQGSIGRIAKTQYDAYVDRTLLIFQSYKVETDVDYFKYVVFLLFEIEKTKAPGGIIKTITKEVLTEFTVPIPSIKEQTKIANFLSALDDKITHCQSELDGLEQWKKGLLQQMFC